MPTRTCRAIALADDAALTASEEFEDLAYLRALRDLGFERLVPELLQDEATPANLAGTLLTLLRDTAAQRRQVERFREFHQLLRQNTAEKAADAVLSVLK